MSRIEVERLSQVDAEAWNNRLLGSTAGFWRQSTFFAEYKQRFWSEEPVYLIARDRAGQIAGQLLACFTHPYGWSLHRRGMLHLAPLLNICAPSFYWLDGPVIFDCDQYDEVLDALLGWMKREGKRRGCVAGKASPSVYGEDFPLCRPVLQRLYAKHGFIQHSRTTILVDLDQELETLFKNLKREARTKIRKASEQGVEVSEVRNDEEGLALLHRVMKETARRNGVPALSLETLRRSSWSYHYPQGLSRGFVSTHQGELISSQQTAVFNRIMCLGGVSYTDYSRDHRIYGNDLMQWHMIEWGKNQGMRILDFAGVAPASSSPKLRAIYEFKSKWGGREVEYAEYTLGYSSWRGRLYQSLNQALGSQLKRWHRVLEQRLYSPKEHAP